MVYELGNEQDQQELVSTLVETLMTGKRYSELENFRFEHVGQVLYILRICSERRKIQFFIFLFIKSFLNCRLMTVNAVDISLIIQCVLFRKQTKLLFRNMSLG